jgi:hypothetical protein
MGLESLIILADSNIKDVSTKLLKSPEMGPCRWSWQLPPLGRLEFWLVQTAVVRIASRVDPEQQAVPFNVAEAKVAVSRVQLLATHVAAAKADVTAATPEFFPQAISSGL